MYDKQFLEEFSIHVTKGMNNCLKEEILKSCKKFFPASICLSKIEDLVLLSYKQQKDIVNFLIGNPYKGRIMKDECFRYILKKSMSSKKVFSEHFEEYQNKYSSRIVNEVFGKKMNIMIVKKSGLFVCPYCNRNYINCRDQRMGSQLDHFYPKSKYPFFAISLFNLIPSCSVCNHMKREKAISASPFDLDICCEDKLRFEYSLDRGMCNKIEVKVAPELMSNVKTLKIEEAYNIHNFVIDDLIEKEKKYCATQKVENRKLFPNLTDHDFDTFLFGNVIIKKDRKSEYYKTPLSKMTFDVYKQIKGKNKTSVF